MWLFITGPTIGGDKRNADSSTTEYENYKSYKACIQTSYEIRPRLAFSI